MPELTITSRTHGTHTFLYDEEDQELIDKYAWSIHYKQNGKYYVCTTSTGYYKPLHNLIMQTPKGMATDHINGDPLDNRRCNLRVCTKQENNRNTGKPVTNTSGYKGVCWSKRDEHWRAAIRNNGPKVNLGGFPTKEDAARAYNSAAIKYHGEFAYTNEIPCNC